VAGGRVASWLFKGMDASDHMAEHASTSGSGHWPN